MPRVRRTRGAAAIALLALATAGCERACGRKPAATATGAEGFAGQSQRLAVIPEGVEMGDGLFSPDGRSVAFVATDREGKTRVFHDGKPSEPYDAATSLVFLPGGKGIAFVAQRGGRVSVVAGGREGAALDGVGRLLAAPDGRVVFSAQRGSERLLVSGKRELVIASAADPDPWVSGDGKRLLYLEQRPEAREAQLHACSLDLTGCIAGQVYEAIGPLVSDGSRSRLAHVALRGDRETAAVLDLARPGLSATEAGWWDGVGMVALSETGEAAFLARRGEQQLLVAGGKELPLPFSESPLELVAGKGGRTIFTTVAGNQVVVLVDGKRIDVEMTGVYFPVLSPDGAHHAFVAERRERNLVVVDGKEGPPYDKVVTPRFSADGSRLVYRARQDGQRFAVVADLQGKTLREHPRYQAVFEVQFSPDGKSVGYGVRKGQELWWMVEPL